MGGFKGKGVGGGVLGGDGMSGMLCIAQHSAPGLLPLPAAGGGFRIPHIA